MRFPAASTTDFMYIIEERLESSPTEVSHAWSRPSLSDALNVFVEEGCLHPDRMYQIYFSVETTTRPSTLV